MTAHPNLSTCGAKIWNAWRKDNPDAGVNLSHARLQGANLDGHDLSGLCLYRAKLEDASLFMANLDHADISEARLRGCNLRQASLRKVVATRSNISRAVCWRADFSGACLHLADFWGTDLSEANLTDTIMTEARLHGAILVRADMQRSDLSKSMVYGSSTWDANLDCAIQRDLVITPDAGRQKWHGFDLMEIDGPVMTVDDLEVSQFIYLLLKNSKLRNVIDTITSKLVLLLGRFSSERKIVLESLRQALRKHGLAPLLFDFEKSSARDFTETVATVGHLSRLVIADLTDPRCVPQELQRLIPSLPSVPVQPIIQESHNPYAMFPDFGAYLSVLPPLRYRDENHLCDALQPGILEPAAARAAEIAARRASYSLGLSH